MIETVPLDFIANLMIGMSIALLAARHIERDKLPPVNHYLIYPILFEALVFGPIGLFLALEYGDWSAMYFVNFSRTSGWVLGPLVLITYTSAILVGYLVAHRWILEGKEGMIKTALIACGILLVLISVGLWERLVHVGRVDDFMKRDAHGNPGTPLLFHHPLFALLIFLGPAFAAAYAVMAQWIARDVKTALGSGVPAQVSPQASSP